MRLMVTLTTVAVAAAGCGGGDQRRVATRDGATRQQYVAKADAICAAAIKRERALVDKPDPAWVHGPRFKDAKFVKRFRVIMGDALRQLKALEPPAEDRKRADAFVGVLERTVAVLDKQAQAAGNGHNPEENAQAYDSAYADVAVTAGPLGLTQCQGMFY